MPSKFALVEDISGEESGVLNGETAWVPLVSRAEAREGADGKGGTGRAGNTCPGVPLERSKRNGGEVS
jgi:hypothetical protein